MRGLAPASSWGLEPRVAPVPGGPGTQAIGLSPTTPSFLAVGELLRAAAFAGPLSGGGLEELWVPLLSCGGPRNSVIPQILTSPEQSGVLAGRTARSRRERPRALPWEMSGTSGVKFFRRGKKTVWAEKIWDEP